MSNRHQLGDLQLAIMRVLWDRGEAAASDVHKALLEERGLAITTIKTMLRKLEERGVVKHRENGRQFIYQAVPAESDVREGMVGNLVRQLFSGDSKELVNHLLQSGDVDAGEIDELKAHIARKREAKRGSKQ